MRINNVDFRINAKMETSWFQPSRLEIKGLKINGLNEKIYSIAAKTIPTTFAGKLMHYLSGGEKKWTKFSYYDLNTKKVEEVYLNKRSIAKHLRKKIVINTESLTFTNNTESFIFTRINPSMTKTSEEPTVLATKKEEEKAFTKLKAPIRRQFTPESKTHLITSNATTCNEKELADSLENITLLTASERAKIAEFWMWCRLQPESTSKEFVTENKSGFSIPPSKSGLKHPLQITINGKGVHSLSITISEKTRPFILQRSSGLRTT